eukprot:CAMPEP_0170625878 /NCGR_PEP_ID=MMETSP0224-20130122/31022_1 /TAXON_ID=285029 /ORGANISM="Togula jolla, Strain CCCM 725" /LENGTH=417 /DNA_ID=CAMNT_0010952539 /DNA_START=19 /DNA_END=1272 /DNA_ORIENTATION=+
MRYSSVLSEPGPTDEKSESSSYPTLSREDSRKTEKVEKSTLRCRVDSGPCLSAVSTSPTCNSGASTYAASLANWADMDPSDGSLGDWDPSETAWAFSQDDAALQAEPEAQVDASMSCGLVSSALRSNSLIGEACQNTTDTEKLALDESSEAKKGWWRLVWCHERCHKEDCDAQRQMLAKHAEALGGTLVCLKKASKFHLWQRRTARPPYILLTDWREVKPCRDYLSGMPRSSLPSLTVVLCEVQRHFERASEWASSLDPSAGQGKLHVCQRVDLANFFFASLEQLTEAAEIPVAASTKHQARLDDLAIEKSSSTVPGAALSRRAEPETVPMLSPEGARQIGTLDQGRDSSIELPSKAPFGSLFAGCKTAGRQPNVPLSGTVLLEPVPVWPCWQAEFPTGKHELERMLKAAMPQHYED